MTTPSGPHSFSYELTPKLSRDRVTKPFIVYLLTISLLCNYFVFFSHMLDLTCYITLYDLTKNPLRPFSYCFDSDAGDGRQRRVNLTDAELGIFNGSYFFLFECHGVEMGGRMGASAFRRIGWIPHL